MSTKLIDLQNISKSYDGNLILDDMNLYIRENEFLTLLVIKTVKEKLPNTPIYIWTGYFYEELLKKGGHMDQILEMADYLIDGPYIEDLRDITLEMRGSSNQKIINLREVDIF